MQAISVYLYPNSIDAYTNSTTDAGSWLTERYRNVYNRNLKIHRGVDNRLDLRVKNSDQKATSISGFQVVFSLVNTEIGKLVLQKDCTVIDASIGKLYVIINAHELNDIEPGNYSYTLHAESRSIINLENYTVTNRIPLYTDSQYSASSTIEIIDDVFGNPTDSFKVAEFSEHIPYDYEYQPRYYISSIIDAQYQLSNPSSVHTFQINLTNYTGSITIQGSQSNGGDPHVWADLDTFDVSTSSTIYKNITGKYRWFRVKHIPNSYSVIGSFVVAQTILGNYEVSVRDGGKGYNIGSQITILGSRLGGEAVTNDLVITVTDVGSFGTIASISWTGVSYNGVRTFVVDADLPVSGTVDSILYR